RGQDAASGPFWLSALPGTEARGEGSGNFGPSHRILPCHLGGSRRSEGLPRRPGWPPSATGKALRVPNGNLVDGWNNLGEGQKSPGSCVHSPGAVFLRPAWLEWMIVAEGANIPAPAGASPGGLQGEWTHGARRSSARWRARSGGHQRRNVTLIEHLRRLN